MRRWHRAWRDGGTEALRSKGPVSRERLSPQQWAWLEAELRKGPLAHGFAHDQRWTLGRIKTLIGRLFHVGYTVEGTSKLMRRHGWSAQVPVRQAMERDDAAVAVWKAEVWPEIKHGARPGRLDLLRGRGRAGAEAAEGTHRGAARRPARCAGARRRRRPGQHRRGSVLPARGPAPPDQWLPHRHGPENRILVTTCTTSSVWLAAVARRMEGHQVSREIAVDERLRVRVTALLRSNCQPK